MRMLTFSKRCAKEILRDPINLAFGLGFPLVLLLLLSAMQANIPVELFEIKRLAPGIAVFGLSFITLFSATLISRDRESAFLQRLYTTPLRPCEFILGYMLPLVPISLSQCAACYIAAFFLGLPITINVIFALILVVPISVFYISVGLLCGSLLGVKQVGGICGALLTNLSAWLSGVWFDLSLVGGVFETLAKILPFYHAVELQRAVIFGSYDNILLHLLIVIGYGAVILVLATFTFLRQMKKH